MKLSYKSLLDKIFVCDPLGTADPVYETDLTIPGVCIDKNKEIIIKSNASTMALDLFEIENEKELIDLAVKALLKSCEISNSIVSSVDFARHLFLKRDLQIARVLWSKDSQFSVDIWKDVFEALGGISDKTIYYTHHVDGLAKNEIMFIPDPEFLGVIPIKDKIMRTQLEDHMEEEYGLGVINTNAAVLVRI